MGYFGTVGRRRDKKIKTVTRKLKEFFARFFDICPDGNLIGDEPPEA